MEYLQITDSNKEVILEMLNKSVDSDGFIVEKKTGNKLICPYTKEHIKASDFSVLPSSAIFVNNKSFCFAEHRAKQM